MYPLDRRKLIYSLGGSLRKTAKLLMVSHSTISRWFNRPEKKYFFPPPMTMEDLDNFAAVTELDILENVAKK